MLGDKAEPLEVESGDDYRRSSLEDVGLDEQDGDVPVRGKALQRLPSFSGHGWGSAHWSSFVIVTAAFTTDAISGPFAFQQSGWGAGFVFLAFGVLTTYYTGVLLGLQTIPLKNAGSYPNIAARALGKPGKWFALAMQVAAYFVFVVVLLVKLGQWASLASRNLEDTRLCLSSLIAIFAVILMGLVQTPTFKHVVPLATLSIALSILRNLLIFVQMGRYNMVRNCSPTYTVPEEGSGLQTFFRGLSTFAWMLGGHGMYPEEIREMKDPEEHYMKALNWAYLIIVAQYVVLIVPSYVIWGQWTSPILLDNLPDDGVTTFIIAISIVWMLITATISNLILALTIEVNIFELNPLRHWEGRFPNALKRILHRGGIVLFQLFFALMLQDAGVGNIQAFVGAFGFGALTFWLPYVLELYRVKRRRIVHVFLLFCGLVLTFFGIFSAIASIRAQTGGKLFGTECHHTNLLDPNGGPCIYFEHQRDIPVDDIGN